VTSVARCAIFLPNLAIFSFGWRVNLLLAGGVFFGYFQNILAENLADFWARFRPEFGS